MVFFGKRRRDQRFAGPAAAELARRAVQSTTDRSATSER